MVYPRRARRTAATRGEQTRGDRERATNTGFKEIERWENPGRLRPRDSIRARPSPGPRFSAPPPRRRRSPPPPPPPLRRRSRPPRSPRTRSRPPSASSRRRRRRRPTRPGRRGFRRRREFRAPRRRRRPACRAVGETRHRRTVGVHRDEQKPEDDDRRGEVQRRGEHAEVVHRVLQLRGLFLFQPR